MSALLDSSRHQRPAIGKILFGATMMLSAFTLIHMSTQWISAPHHTNKLPELHDSQNLDRLADNRWNAIHPSAGEDDESTQKDQDGAGEPDQQSEQKDEAAILTEPDRGLLQSRERVLNLDTTGVLEDVATDLMRRRQALEEREAALVIREAALAVTKSKLATQIDQLDSLKNEIASMIEEVEADEEERLRQLVKVYETMKSKQAAAIFDRLDPDVMLKVAVRMRETKLSGILARMEPARARYLTAELARQLELPSLKE